MTQTVKVWDPLVRIFHWGLVASFAVAWITAEDLAALHNWAGYAAGGLIAFRLIWGLAGPRYARFRQFVRAPIAVAGYCRDMVLRRERRHLGHNPAGGMMVLALIASMAGLCLTGWMQTLGAYADVGWVADGHELLANLLLLLVGLHVGGVLFASLRHGENLVRAMITGRKRAAEGRDVG